MGDVLSGGIEAKGIDPQTQFKAAASGIPAAPKPYVTFPVKPEAVDKIINNMGKLKGRTDDAEIVTEKSSDGKTRYSFIDNRNNQPLAVMQTQNGQTSLTLYKSPEQLAQRIDSAFVKAADIKEFISESRADAPARAAAISQQIS